MRYDGKPVDENSNTRQNDLMPWNKKEKVGLALTGKCLNHICKNKDKFKQLLHEVLHHG